MTTTERVYWKSSILTNKFFHNDKTKDPEPKTTIKPDGFLQSSLLHSARLKRTLEESRRAFFNMDEHLKNAKATIQAPHENKKVSAKKISFKIKKVSSIYRKNANINRTPNSVAELTTRFNKLDDPKLSKIVNNLKNTEDGRLKLNFADQRQIGFIRRPSVKRKTSLRKLADVSNTKIGKVKATIEIFETITSNVSPTNEQPAFGKPRVPEKKFGPELMEIVNKNKERNSKLLLTNKQPQKKLLMKNSTLESVEIIIPDDAKNSESINACPKPLEEEVKLANSFQTADEALSTVKIPNKSFLWSRNMPEYPQIKILEQLEQLYDTVDPPNQTIDDDGYEYCENIYETLPIAAIAPSLPPKRQQVPLPPRPPSLCSSATDVSNCYESICGRLDAEESNYESIDACSLVEGVGGASVAGSASSDDRSNSLYVCGGGGGSDRAADEWVDLSDDSGRAGEVDPIVVVKEKPKIGKRNSGWSQKCREQRKKAEPAHLFEEFGDTDSDHIYESLCGTTPKEKESSALAHQKGEEEHDAYDSFDSDSECDYNIKKDTVDITNAKLPQLPINQTSVSTIAKTLRKNFTKSFHKMTKRKSEPEILLNTKSTLYQNITYASTTKPPNPPHQNTNTAKKPSLFNKFRRSMTFVSDTFITIDPAPSIDDPPPTQRPKSTFYLTDATVTDPTDDSTANPYTDRPPPTPNLLTVDQPLNNRLCADSGLFKRCTNWYADVGLYQRSCDVGGAPTRPGVSSGSSAENSGGTTASASSFDGLDSVLCADNNEEIALLADREEYYNMRNGMGCGKSQRWLDEPLYQFYDAAILESEYKDSTRTLDYDGYEEVGKVRPTAMELIAPVKNSVGVAARTLWCEVPEVLQSAVLSSLSETQQKIQEAKFEMLTSEASYLHSLNVLVDHFIKNIKHSELLTDHETKLLFGNIFAVKDCSEKLLADLENCWQDNILLTNICEIVNKHAEDNFHVYVTFCENQIVLDSTLIKLKERLSFSRYLEQLERSAACHSLKLNSFLLLPMQRITRWRLLVDAVLKRLVVEDDEYMSSRNTMATITKIAQQCNEAARNMERTLEIRQISKQLEFAKGVPPVDILDNGGSGVRRFLIKSGPLTQMVAKTGDLKVTFGKRFTKIPLHLFLFNDILLLAKARSKDNYLVLHYCYRNFIEVNTEDSLESLPLKNTQGRHLIFLTILENHDEKLIEFLLSCDSVSDKERWLEAILPPKSENPDEIIYENWDCPQVTAVHNYAASQPDEMSLCKGDVINVDKKLTDGWYHGEKISDSQIGWFPSNYTITITNQHVRARNLKMRMRHL